MEAIADPLDKQILNVLLVGNNPSIMSSVFEALKPMNGVRYNTEFVFDMSDLKKTIRRFKPSCIIIHDDIKSDDIQTLFKILKNYPETPVTLIKHSNEHGNIAADVTEFILEQELSPDKISKTLIRSINSRQKHFKIVSSFSKIRRARVSYHY